jgi:hypothetical protein
MPVFSIVPYRTEARTRSEARIQAEVDRLLLILKTVNELIRTAEGRLIELFRPPPVTLGTFIDPDLGISNMELRAYQKKFKTVPLTRDRYRWGDPSYELARERFGWGGYGTLQ